MVKYINQPIFYNVMKILEQKTAHIANRILISLLHSPYSKNYVLAFDLGLISYNTAYNMQIKIFEILKSNAKPGALLLLEHYPVITTGNNKNLKNLLVTKEKLYQQNIELIYSNRGGDITLHTPGQIVCYVILNLSIFKKDLSLFVYNIEQVIVNVLKNFEIQASRINKHRGVFVGNSKIASIGLKVKKWITLHGFSLNVNNDLEYFDNIIACGLKNYPQTSMEKILKRPLSIYNVKEQIIESFSDVFNISVKKI